MKAGPTGDVTNSRHGVYKKWGMVIGVEKPKVLISCGGRRSDCTHLFE